MAGMKVQFGSRARSLCHARAAGRGIHITMAEVSSSTIDLKVLRASMSRWSWSTVSPFISRMYAASIFSSSASA
jgi:hypothetical protein